MNPEKKQVHDYWNDNPVHSLEFTQDDDILSFCNKADALRWSDNERWAKKTFYDFKVQKGKKLLDAGCGIGVFSRFYARQGFEVYSVDITEKAVEITQKSLELLGLKANVIRGDVENLPFQDNFFDYLVSNGVIHHTPDTIQAVNEFYRVLRPGGTASICVYYRNILLNRHFFNLLRLMLPLFLNKNKLVQRENLLTARTPEEFVQYYDGNKNPVAKVYSTQEADELFHRFKIIKREAHYFPARFMKIAGAGGIVHKMLDRYFGTLIYYLLEKP